MSVPDRLDVELFVAGEYDLERILLDLNEEYWAQDGGEGGFVLLDAFHDPGKERPWRRGSAGGLAGAGADRGAGLAAAARLRA